MVIQSSSAPARPVARLLPPALPPGFPPAAHPLLHARASARCFSRKAARRRRAWSNGCAGGGKPGGRAGGSNRATSIFAGLRPANMLEKRIARDGPAQKPLHHVAGGLLAAAGEDHFAEAAAGVGVHHIRAECGDEIE